MPRSRYLVGNDEWLDVLGLKLTNEIRIAQVAGHFKETDVISMIALDEHLFFFVCPLVLFLGEVTNGRTLSSR